MKLPHTPAGNRPDTFSSTHRLAALAALMALSACGGGGGASGSLISASVGAELGQISTGSTNETTASRSTTTSASSPQLPPTPTPTAELPPAPASIAAPPPAPAPAPAPIPIAPFTCDAAAITCLQITSTGSATQASVPLTFGQPFKAGDWRASTQGLMAKVDGAVIPVQTDEVSSHRDGSTRFAVVSAQLSSLGAGQTKIINLYTGAKTTSTPAVPANPDWNLEVETQLFDANGNVTATLVARPQAQLVAQIASNSGRRLSGAVASEYTVVTDFKDKATGVTHPHLSARFHTRLVDGGSRIRTDVVMENTRTWTTAPSNITYSMVVKRNGTTLHTQPKFTHFRQARWHKVVWSGSNVEPQARVVHNMPYFMASKAIWNYDLSLTVPETYLASTYARLNQLRSSQAALGPMASLMLEKAFGNTGARDDIGPLPRWVAIYLISQDDRAREVMLANADASASVTVHFRDEVTGQPVDLDNYPTLSLRFGRSIPALPTATGDSFWRPDQAHQGSFSYVPYLITGDAFYLDETLFWSGWNLASPNPEYRGKGQGLLDSNEVRAMAWSLRSVWEAHQAAPDNHPLKSYMGSRLQNNLTYLAQQYRPGNTQVSPMGMVLSGQTGGGDVAPWQNDFVVIVTSLIAENGSQEAASLTNWITRFTIGRFKNESAGFCVAYAPGYYWKPKNSVGQYISGWKELWDFNYPGVGCQQDLATQGYPDLALGYAASARAMMAAAHNAGIGDANLAYQMWKSKTPKMDWAFATDPTWAIVPRN